MLNNTGAYGLSEASESMIASINGTQSSESNKVVHSFGTFEKITQQEASTSSGQYGIHNYLHYGQPAMNLSPQLTPFQACDAMGIPPNIFSANSQFLQQNHGKCHDQNYFTTEDTSSQNDELRRVLNYTGNTARNMNKADNFRDENNVRNFPINKPQVPENDRQSEAITEHPSSDNNNAENDSHISEDCILERTRVLKRKSLEKTVKLIEDILIKTVNNKKKTPESISKSDTSLPEKSNSRHKNDHSKLRKLLSSKSHKIYNTDSNTDNTAINSDAYTKTYNSETEINSTIINCSNTSKTEGKTQGDQSKPEHNYILEPIVKVECTNGADMDYQNPFLRDMNGRMLETDSYMKVIDPDNSYEEACETIKRGTISTAYFQCPFCSLLLIHPKRYLIHLRWHNFGLINDKRAESAKEKEEKKIQRRQARMIGRLNALNAAVGDAANYPCKDCDKVFPSKSSLKNHRNRYHPRKITECKICLTPVAGWAELRAHVVIHTDKDGSGLHQCPHCPKRFKYRHSLAKHSDTHLEKTQACPVCSKMFGSENLVKLHMKTHERAARGLTYHCSYCGKGFYEHYHLHVHERTHTNDKPFICDICNSCFLTNSSLKRHHKVSHSANVNKPYVCSICQRAFVSAAICERHELRAHADPEMFPCACELCPRRYLKPKDLRNHMYKSHPKAKKQDQATDSE